MKHLALFSATLLLAACGPVAEAPQTSTPSPESIPDTRDAPSPAAGTPEADTVELLAGLPAPYSQADLANGARQFRRCTSCHTIGEGGPNRVGPNLHGLFDRSAGAVESFTYSATLQDADFQWTPDHVDDWLADPRGYLPGNRMSFVGLRDANDRRDVIAYLLIETAR